MSGMIQISNSISEILSSNTVGCNGQSNGQSNDKNNLIRNHGWFLKKKNILKYLTRRMDDGSCAETARCFECYELVGFEDISYSRIISNYNRASGSSENNKIIIKVLSSFEKYYKLSVICSGCVCSKTEFKNAPQTYSDIITDIIIYDKMNILADDLEQIGCKKLDQLNDSIVNLLFNYNEKQIMFNHIIKENDNLKRNLDMEIEKYKVLSEYKSKNRELQDSMKNYLLQSSINLFKTHKQIMDEQIAKYSEYNNSTRYNVPECKICMLQEVSMVLECGHLLCTHCHDKIHTENRKKIDANYAQYDNNDNNDNNDTEESIQVDGYPCPFCKTFASKFIKIFL